MIYSILVALIVIICLLLILVVLLQPGQGEGLSGGIAGGMGGGGMGGPQLGARRTADMLSKSTAILGTAFLVLSVLANFFIESGEQDQSAIQQQGVPQTNTQQPPGGFDLNNQGQGQQGQGQTQGTPEAPAGDEPVQEGDQQNQ